MATEELIEKHFTCPICQDQLDDPRHLTCGHVLCFKCLEDLIAKTADWWWIRKHTLQVFGFKCPECRKVIRIPRPNEPENQWARQINKDYKLAGILSSMKEAVANSSKDTERNDEESKKVGIAGALPEMINRVEIQTQTVHSGDQTNPIPVENKYQACSTSDPKSKTYTQVKGNFLKVIQIGDMDKSQALFDLVVLIQGDERVIVTPDFERNQLLKFSLNKENDASEVKALNLVSKPWRICKMSDTQVAVTISEPDGIQIVSVKDELSVDRFIRTRKHYDGIATFSDKFILTTSDNVDVVRSHDGHVLQEFIVSAPNVKFPDISYATCTTTGNIVVTDCGGKMSFLISQEGKVLWRKKMDPLGVACDRDDQVFFVDKNTEVVYMFTSRGRFLCKVVEKSVNFAQPSGIALDGLGYMYVVCKNNTITVWELRKTEN